MAKTREHEPPEPGSAADEAIAEAPGTERPEPEPAGTEDDEATSASTEDRSEDAATDGKSKGAATGAEPEPKAAGGKPGSAATDAEPESAEADGASADAAADDDAEDAATDGKSEGAAAGGKSADAAADGESSGAEADGESAEDEAEGSGESADEDGPGTRGKRDGASGTAKAAAAERARRRAARAGGSGGGSGRSTAGTWADPLARTALAVVALALVFAAWGGWSWYTAAHDDGLKFSELREQVRQAGEQDVQNLSTFDYRRFAQGLASWRDSSTGELHDQIVQGSAQFEKDVQSTKTITSAKVLSSGVTELDERAGKASMIFAVRITATSPDGQPSVKQSRLAARLERTPSGWKVSGLGEAPTGGSGS